MTSKRIPARPFRSREWFADSTRNDMTAVYLERYMNYGLTAEELRDIEAYEAVAAIYAPYVLDTAISFEEVAPTASEMRDRMSRILTTYPYLVFDEAGAVAAYAYASPHAPRAAYRWSVDVAVYAARSIHRRGVGRALYSTLFPILARQVNGKPLIYLDSAASAQKPDAVLDAMMGLARTSYANVHRGLHTLANETTEAYEKARETVARFINAEPTEIVWTKSATEAVNLVAATFGQSLKAGDEIRLIDAQGRKFNIFVAGIRTGSPEKLSKDKIADALSRLVAIRPRLVMTDCWIVRKSSSASAASA